MTMPEQKKAVVPRLRFPEFRDAGPWEVKRLGDVAEVNAAGDLDFSQFSPVLTQEHIYPIYSNSIAQEGLYGFSTYPKYKKNSVTITARGTLGVAFYRDHDFVGIGRLLIVNARQEISPRYLKEVWNYLVREPFENGGIPQLTAIKARTIKLVFPSLPEQQKIADCLSSLDELIKLQAKQLEALQAHKKGLMQQLFPREGETTPRLRFPEFRDAGPWEVKRLGEICSFLKGKGLPKTAITAEGSVPCIHYGELFTEYGEVIRKVKSCTNTTTDSVLSEEDDVLMPTSDVTPNGLAKASCIKEKNVVLGGDILVIRPNKQQVFGEYLSRYIRYQEKDVLRLVTGTTVFHLYGNAISHLRVSLPRMSEQQKIADCLSSLDELIELQAKQLEALKAHKKGLMQQLFPQEIDL